MYSARVWGRSFAAGVAALALMACKSQSLDVGGDASAVAAADGAAADGGMPTVWTGYLENYQLQPSGSDHVTITFTSETTGTVFFGDPPALAPPTDPDVGYPPGVKLAGPGSVDRGRPQEKFAFTIQNEIRADARITFNIAPDEVWDAWCRLQQSYPLYTDPDASAPFEYACLPLTGYSTVNGECFLGDPSTDGGSQHPIDCGKLTLCYLMDRVCRCTATACNADTGGSGVKLRFDLQVTADGLNGSMAIVGGTVAPTTVHLMPR